MSVKRESQIPAGPRTEGSLARAPRVDVVQAVTAPSPAPAPEAPAPAAAPRARSRSIPFTNRLDPELLDWLNDHRVKTGIPIAAVLDEAVRDYIEKTTGHRPSWLGTPA